VDGRTFTTPVGILPDPRVTVSRADLEQQLAFALALREDLTRLSGTVHQLRSVRDQVKARRDRSGAGPRSPPRRGGGRARREVRRPRGEAAQPEGGGQLRHPGEAGRGEAVLAPRTALLRGHDGDGRPTQGMREVYAELKKELDALRAEWQAILETDVPALNAKARDLLPDLIVLPGTD